MRPVNVIDSVDLMEFVDATRAWAKRIKRDAITLWFARNHPRTPWYAKALAAVVVAYALSPIDLIPDFIPVLGYLDDVIVLPVLIWATVRLLPAQVLEDSRGKAEAWIAGSASRPCSLWGAVLVVSAWAAVAVVFWVFTTIDR